MRKLTRSILAATAVVGLLAIPVAATANPDTSTVTFTVENNGTLSVAMADKNIGTFDSASATEATGALPEVTVTDSSNPLNASYNVTALSSDFVGQSATPHTITADNVSYWSGPVTDLVDADANSLLGLDPQVALVVAVGQQTLAGDAVAIDSAQDAVVVSSATGNHTLKFTPNLIVDLTGVPADTYSGTITHSAG